MRLKIVKLGDGPHPTIERATLLKRCREAWAIDIHTKEKWLDVSDFTQSGCGTPSSPGLLLSFLTDDGKLDTTKGSVEITLVPESKREREMCKDGVLLRIGTRYGPSYMLVSGKAQGFDPPWDDMIVLYEYGS